MLRKIIAEFENNPRAICLEELSHKLSIETGALDGMLQTLVRKGRLLEINGGDNACPNCPARGSCVVMDGLGRGYMLNPASNRYGVAAPR